MSKNVPTINLKDLITVTQAAELRGCSRTSIYKLIERGKLNYKVAKLLSRKEVAAFKKDKPGPKPKPRA